MNMNPAQILETITSGYGIVTEQYAAGIMLAGLVFALLNCFMGYKLRKLWGSLLGLLIGAAGGAAAGYYFLDGVKYAVLTGALGAVLLCVLAWVFYKFGIFLLCTGLVYSLVNSFFSADTTTGKIICLVVGIFAATMALGYEEYIIIGITGICGGTGAVKLLFGLTNMEAGAAVWLLGLILSFLGIAVQAAPLMKKNSDRRDKKGTSFFSNKKKRKFKLPSLPSLPGRKKKKKKTVYQTEKTIRTSDSRSSRKTPDKGKKREELDNRVKQDGQAQESDSESVQKGEQTFYQGAAVDLDDLSRELSQEIQKIYEEEN